MGAAPREPLQGPARSVDGRLWSVLLLPAAAGWITLELLDDRGPQASLAALAAAGLVAVLIDRRVKRRIDGLRGWAARVRRGERVTPPLAASVPDRLDELSWELGDLVGDLQQEIGRLVSERDSLEAILAAMVEGVLVLDLAGRVLRANARALETFGIPPGAVVVGRRLWDLCRDPELARVMADAIGQEHPAAREVELQAPVPRVLRISIGPVADGTAYVLVSHDVTATKRLERMRTDLVANVSHELRTPLTAIKGFAETLLASGFSDEERARHYVAIIDRQAERVTRLIADLLTLSDLELGRAPMRAEPVALVEVVREVTDYLAESARKAGVKIEVDVPAGLRVVGDADRLSQIVSNLLDNAIKYTPRGGRVTIGGKGFDGGRSVELVVADSGCGIPADELPRVAERFYRVDKARSRELGGTGLGLAIVKHIVQAHGGSLQIESRVGEGTTVRVSLPGDPEVSLGAARLAPG